MLQITGPGPHMRLVFLVLLSGLAHAATFTNPNSFSQSILRYSNDDEADCGWTPLHYAAEGDDSDATEGLLNSGSDMNARDCNERTPLHVATQNGNFRIVRKLLEYGAEGNARDKDKKTPLHYAAIGGYAQIVSALLKDAEKRIAARSFWNVYGNFTKLNASVSYEDADKRTPLHYAAQKGHWEAAKVLLNDDAYKRTESSWSTLKRYAKPCLINEKDHHGHTPLHIASESGYLDIAKGLLECGAEMKIWDHSGHTPLHLAAKGGHLEVVKLFLENRAETDVETHTKQTALHLSAAAGHVAVSKILLVYGADIDATDCDIMTPLHYAASNNQLKIIELLLSRGANRYLPNSCGNVPLQVAMLHKHKDAAQLLMGPYLMKVS